MQAAEAAPAIVDHPVHDNVQRGDPRNSTNKRWLCTVFDNDWEPTFPAAAIFGSWQRERCPTTGRIHVHIYVRYDTKKRMNTVKNDFGRQDMNCQPCRGNEQQCVEYVEKEESRITAGARWRPENFDANQGKQGHRTDLDTIAKKANEGVPLAQIATDHPGDYIRYHSGIQAYHALVQKKPPLERDMNVYVLWGPTGQGKTHRVMHRWPDCYCVKPGRDPWGNYRGEDCIFFDEFNWERWEINTMKQYLDKWRLLLDARYHDRYAAWTQVVICCNSSPMSWYPLANQPDIDALRRRLIGRCWLIQSREDNWEELEPNPNFS